MGEGGVGTSRRRPT